MFYRIKEDRLYDWAEYKYADDCLETDIIDQQTLEKDFEQVIIDNGILILNPDYEEIIRQRQEKIINNLTMTPLDFITVLENLGISYTDIQNYLNEHPELDKQLKYCQNVYCGVVKQVLPISVAGIEITVAMIEKAFKDKHGME